MNTEQDTIKPPRTTFNEQIQELAGALRDIIQDTPMAEVREDPELAFTDLACRLVIRLKSLTIIPTEALRRYTGRMDAAQAALRIFDIFTKFLREHPKCSYVTRIGASGRFEIIVKTPSGKTQLFFGESAQDAYAQVAQTISLNGGTL